MGNTVTAILLAAGQSSRMGQGVDKLALPYGGRTLLERAAELLCALPVEQKILVATPLRLEALRLPAAILARANPHPERGQSESLRLGLAAATEESYLFLTADQPLLDVATVRWLLELADGTSIVYPTVAGKPRSPVLFPARFRQELLAGKGDQGGRQVRAAHPRSCLALEAEDPAPFWDIDTPEDYKILLNGQRLPPTSKMF